MRAKTKENDELYDGNGINIFFYPHLVGYFEGMIVRELGERGRELVEEAYENTRQYQVSQFKKAEEENWGGLWTK